MYWDEFDSFNQAALPEYFGLLAEDQELEALIAYKEIPMKPPIIDPQASLTFSDYIKLNADLDDILTYFGYSLHYQNGIFPQPPPEANQFGDLKSRLEKIWPYLSLTSEAARREFLIAPVLFEIALLTKIKIRVEYSLKVNEQLKGTLDYFLEGKNNLLVIEAKNADPSGGLIQLAVELVALDQWLEDGTERLYGAVSLGDMWRFAILERQSKKLIQDLNLYGVPANLEALMSLLVAILTG